MLYGGGGGTKILGWFLCGSLKLSHIEGGGATKFQSLKGGSRKVLPCLGGGRREKFWTHDFFHFVAPLPHN